MAGRRDLDALSAATGVPVVPSGEPGGGYRVGLVDPSGVAVEAFFGVASAPPLPPRRPPRTGSNFGERAEFARLGSVKRVEPAVASMLGESSSCVKRLGHCVMNVEDYEVSAAWYKLHFGRV